MQFGPLRTSIAIIGFLATTACGGGGGGGGNYTAMIPPPPVTPPAPTPQAGPAIPAAVQTTAPASPAAGTTTFSTLTQTTDFPLLMTAARGGPGDGDPVTTSAGGVLRANPGGTFRLTINNLAAAFNDSPIPAQPGGGLWWTRATVNSANLDYTRYGYWAYGNSVDGTYNLGAWTTGFITPTAALPAAGTATYAGTAAGLYNAALDAGQGADFDSSFIGNVMLTANFGSSTLSGSITNITATSLYSTASGAVNDIGFSASIDRTNNLFAGTTGVAGSATGPYAFGPTASGLINGRFYGPSAIEIGAVFNLSEGTRRLVGSFGAKQ